MRRDLMNILYSKLPNGERHVLPNKKVSGIEQDDVSVTVTCVDGSVFKGDILIGCDGVHSVVRRLVVEQANPPPPNPGSEYRGLFGSCPLPEGLAPCNIAETHDRDIVFMILCSHDTAFWLISNRKDKLDSQRYTAEDIQALVDKYKDHSVAPGAKVTFKDLWEARNTDPSPGMYDYNEGIAEKWYKGRVVIVGDAAHRVGFVLLFFFPSFLFDLTVIPDDAEPRPRRQQLDRIRRLTGQPDPRTHQRATKPHDSRSGKSICPFPKTTPRASEVYRKTNRELYPVGVLEELVWLVHAGMGVADFWRWFHCQLELVAHD